MRLYEIAPPRRKPAQTPEGILATLLQFLLTKSEMPDHKSDTVTVSTDTVLALMNNTGVGFTYNDLKALIDSSDRIKNMVNSHDKKHLEIKKETNDEETDFDTSSLDSEEDIQEPLNPESGFGDNLDLTTNTAAIDPNNPEATGINNQNGAPPFVPSDEDKVVNMARRASKKRDV